MLRIRPPMGDPLPNPPAQYFWIEFRHPGYGDSVNDLLMLPALDSGGIHHETARIACAILANNRWDGWFTERRDGDRVAAPNDGILRERCYYFHVSDDANERYPIVPNFTHWRFPHSNLPESWQGFSIPKEPGDRFVARQRSTLSTLLNRDISCRVTKHVEGNECAHLVPKSELIWFRQNGMTRYCNPTRAGAEYIDDAQNAILLRSDVHKFFDDKRLAFILKHSAELPSTTALVIHVFMPDPNAELTGLYHNLSLQQLTGISVEYLFARFAWTIFDFVRHFLLQGPKRRICVANTEASGTCIREASGEELGRFTLPTKSQSGSPRKRKQDDSGVLEELDDESSESSEEEPRGRRRKRSFSPESFIAPCSSIDSTIPRDGSGFTDRLKADSDSNTDLSLSEVPLKKQKTSESHVGPVSTEMR